MSSDPDEGTIPIKCPGCPEAIDVSWSSERGTASWRHRGLPCPHFRLWLSQFVHDFIRDPDQRAKA